jgi:23S rRNA (pseudouridine1915-N3)-methyltransferase
LNITIHAIGKRMPAWIRQGFEDYQGRFPRHVKVSLREINMPERVSNCDVLKLKEEEGDRLLARISSDDVVIALDESGKQWSSRELSAHLATWLQEKRDLSLLVGGPDGLSRQCLDRADRIWSLSRLTLPHMLVRVLLAEQLYRAFAITQNHPYHRD